MLGVAQAQNTCICNRAGVAFEPSMKLKSCCTGTSRDHLDLMLSLTTRTSEAVMWKHLYSHSKANAREERKFFTLSPDYLRLFFKRNVGVFFKKKVFYNIFMYV